ncbi:MAG: hypothetical protein ACI4WZ_05355 [Eubacteriales bacterium]
MKKLLTLALALTMALSLSVTAFAADITQDSDPKTAYTSVTFNVDPTYTVTIPATVTLAKAEDGSYKQDVTITAADVRLEEGKTIKVTLASDFKLTTGAAGATYELNYTVTVGDSATAIATGDTVATFTTDTNSQSSILHFAADNPTYAGEYKDTVTFTIVVE